MVLEGAQGLGDDGVCAARKVNQRAEVVLQFRVLRLARVGASVDAHRVARSGQIPTGEVEEVNRLLEYPVADVLDVVTPALGAGAIRVAPQLDQDVERLEIGRASCRGRG